MNIAILGHFGGSKKFFDGQTNKTKEMYEVVAHACTPEDRVYKIDTFYLRKNPFRFGLSFLCNIIRCKKIVVLLSKNGRRYLFPILSFFQINFGKQIYHNCIGGNLCVDIKNNAKMKRYLNSFVINWVESRIIRDELMELGVQNVDYLPNFKAIQILEETEFLDFHEPFPFVYFGRVVKEKGIEDAIDAICQVNQNMGKVVATMDIYGPIPKEYHTTFEKRLAETNGTCCYRGIVSPKKSVDILKKYYVMLFPTFWVGEGIPGAVVDAYCAGLPVIARRWKYADELISHGKTGYVYNVEYGDELARQIVLAMRDVHQNINMRRECIKIATTYTEEAVKPIICQKFFST